MVCCLWCNTRTAALIPSRQDYSFGQCPRCGVHLTQLALDILDGLRLRAYVEITKREDAACIAALSALIGGILAP